LRAPTPTAAATLITPDIRETRSALAQFQTTLNKQIQTKLNTEQQRLDFAAQGLKHPRDRLILQAGELRQLTLKLDAAYRHKLETGRRRLENLHSRIQSNSPENRLNTQRYSLDKLVNRLNQRTSVKLKTDQANLDRYRAALQAFSPLQTLARGFSILQNEHGELVRSSDQVKSGEHIQARLHRGELDVKVIRKNK